MPIHFGTDGWRAVISDTFTFHNLRLVTQAIADAISSGDWQSNEFIHWDYDPKKIIVGFDTRFLSDRYAREVSRVLAANGFKVLLTQADAPTPAISFSVKHYGAIAGIVITASHNAPRYNGLKLKAAFGGSALPDQSRRVEIYLNDNEERGRGPNLMDWTKARELGLIKMFNPLPDYYTYLRKMIDFDAISENPPRIVVDSMHGSGRGVIKGVLKGSGCEVKEIRGDMNPGFGGVHPEPIGKNLGALAGAITNAMGDLGLATDGDGDRIGAMDEKGSFVDPHRIMSLAIKYLVEKKKLSGSIVRTVSTTRMIDRLAKKYNVKLHETPVGFNHIADHMLSGEVLIGGEESGGISFAGHIPEGDGVLMGLLLVEMVAVYGVPLSELVDALMKDVGPVVYERKDLRLAHPISKSKMTASLTANAPKSIGGVDVSEVKSFDGVKFILEDDSWLLIRPSGTEPVLRVYAEGRTEDMVKNLLEYGAMIAQSIT